MLTRLDAQLLHKSPMVCWHGRVSSLPEGVEFHYTHSGFTVQFIGRRLEAVFMTDTRKPEEEAYIKVMHQNQSPKTIRLKKSAHREVLTLYEGYLGTHTIEVRKQSEAIMGRTTLLSLSTDGGFQACRIDKRLKIEFIGDSITCGYGNLSTDSTETFTTETEDGQQTYAAFTAAALDACFEVVAVSGIGLYRSFYASRNMLDLYRSVAPYTLDAYAVDRDFDVIVVALGTNDHHYLSHLEAHSLQHEQQQFKNAYQTFIGDLAAWHPSALIFSVRHEKRHPLVADFIAEAVEAVAHPRIKQVCIEPFPDCDGIGAQYHPTTASHRRMGVALAKEIEASLKGVRR